MPNSINPEDIWNKRSELRGIHDFAKARRVSPWATVGITLIRSLMTVPPNVVLPAIIGGEASLNPFLNVVGTSGLGKGAATAASRACVKMPPIFTAPVGSGEGMVRQFAQRREEKDDTGQKRWITEMVRTAVLFEAPEVDTLAALGARSGTTMMSEFRKAYSGEPLGFGYANQEKAATLDAHSYRAGLIVGVQPRRAAALLEDADGGTPQRFVWMPARDPEMTFQKPEEPEPYVLPSIDWGSHGHVMKLPDRAVEAIERHHIEKHIGNSSAALDAHGLLTRMKVAAAFAILAGRKDVSSSDWFISRLFMAKSDETRELCVAELKRAMREEAQERGRHRAVSDHARNVESEAMNTRRRRRIISLLEEHGPLTRSGLERNITRANRPLLNADLKVLLGEHRVTFDDSKYAVTPQPMQ